MEGDDLMIYETFRNTTAVGLETGDHYRLEDGGEVEAPEGEFDHLSEEVIAPKEMSEPPTDIDEDDAEPS